MGMCIIHLQNNTVTYNQQMPLFWRTSHLFPPIPSLTNFIVFPQSQVLWTLYPFPFIFHLNLFPISSCTYVFILAEQQVLECLFECGIAQCITSWVDSRVDITQPVSNRPHSVWHTGMAEGWDQHHDIIWCPRNDESQQDGKDSLGHL